MKAPEELLFEIDALRIKYRGQKFDIEKGSPYIEEATELINQFKGEVCEILKQELQVAKTYFELASDRVDPYPAIKDGLNRIKCVLAEEG